MSSTELTTQNSFNQNGVFQPQSFQELMTFSKILSTSDFVPRNYRNKPHDVLICIQMGAEVGLHAIQSLNNIAVINSKPCLFGDALLAAAQRSSAFEYIKETDDGETDRDWETN